MPHLNQSPINHPVLSPLLVGRAQEREYLRQVLDAANQGRGAVVLLAGEAGVGKSRLAADARQQAVTDGFDVLVGHCFENDDGYAYAPIIDALRAWLAPLPAAKVAAKLGMRAAEVVKLLPELVHSVPDIQPTAPLDAEAEKRRLIESLYHVLVQGALPPQPTPLLLIVEDLHWSDESSLAFLHLLARRIAGLPLVVIATYRSDEDHAQLRQWLAQVARERLAHELALRPLTFHDVRSMVQAIFMLAQPPKTETIAPLFKLTEGNPFFVEEVLKALVSGGSIFLRDNQWERKSLEEIQIPDSIHDAVNRRTAWLSPEARRVLILAAVAGRRFDFALLRHITGHGEAPLLVLIKELVAAQLVVEESAERFAFRHALTQQVVYAGLLARECQPLHRAIGNALENLYATSLSNHVVQLAHHFYAAREWSKASVYAHQAGKQAQALAQPRAAAEQWTRALAAADQLPAPQPRLPMLRGRGWAYDLLGQIEAARTDYEEALQLARGLEDTQAEWQTLLDLGALWSAQDYARAGDYFQQTLDLARRESDNQMLAHSLNRIGNWHLNLNQPHAALRYHLDALQIFLAADDLQGQATTYDFLGMTTWNCGDILDSVRYYQQALTLSQTLNDRAAMSSIWATLASYGPSYMTELLVGQPTPLHEEARTREPGRLLAQEIGWRAGEAYALFTLGQALAYRGEYGRSLDYSTESLAISEAIEHHEWMAAAHCGLSWYYLDTLATESARAHATAALDLAQRTGSNIWRLLAGALLAHTHLALDEPTAAEAVLASSIGQEAGMVGGNPTASDRHCIMAMARLELATGAPARALRVVDDLIATTPNIELTGMQPAPVLLLLRAEALMTLSKEDLGKKNLGKEDEAEGALRLAHAGATDQMAAPLLWRILAQLATLYHRQGRYVEAGTAATRAQAVIERVAQTISETTARQTFIERACHRLPAVSAPRRTQSATAPGGLTAREAEVADLIAQGHTNREIAAQLVITERTVTTHISHIFDKLDFRTRTQIAVWVASQSQQKADGAEDTAPE